MTLRRFKVGAPLVAGSVALEGEEARHLRVVLRARAGEKIELFDGSGREAEAEVLDIGREAVACRVTGAVRSIPEPGCHVELVCAFPRAGAADDVVRVAVEVGVRGIRPLLAERGVWRPDDPGESQRPERFRRAAVAALKQSGLSWMPEFFPPADPTSLPLEPGVLALVGSVGPDARPIAEVLESKRPVSRAVVIVGPEGGLTDREERLLVSKGAVPVRSGAGTLRVETAVIVLVSHVLSFGPSDP